MAERCYACGRPLRDPASQRAGIGPVCAAIGAKRRYDVEPMLFRSSYSWEIIDGALVMFDKGGSVSLTNDIERALREVAATLGDGMPDVVIYRDSLGTYDRIRHRRGAFGGFIGLGEMTLWKALDRVRVDIGATT